MINPVLKAIKNRRSSLRFKTNPIDDQKLNIILEAGRYAPSWTNMQPWRFIVIKDKVIQERMSRAVSTFFNLSIKDAPICIAVCVNPTEDPFHFLEDGTTATQNMALAAQSIGLSTSWIGVFSLTNEKNSTERKLKKTLKIPEKWRLVSILPVGVPKFKQKKTRKKLSKIVDLNYFITREKHKTKLQPKEEALNEIEKTGETGTVRDLERAIV